MDDGLRIGDAERDDAVALLQQHLTAGRLTHDEFDDRIARALVARTNGELAALFSDLPGRRPGGVAPAPLGATAVAEPAPPAPFAEGQGTPWYAQWWMILVAVAIAGVTRGGLGPVVPLMAVWLWVVYPSLRRNQRRAAPHPVVEPSAADRAAITAQLRRGEKVRAIKTYREATGAGLADAKRAVDLWERELG